MVQMRGVFAEFERAMIRERVMAGLARARAEGKRLGRPRLPAEKEQQIKAALEAGMGILKAAKTFGTGVAAVQRIKAALSAA
jgi:DNA invertase Pin-like site-specific DNA recombinase